MRAWNWPRKSSVRSAAEAATGTLVFSSATWSLQQGVRGRQTKSVGVCCLKTRKDRLDAVERSNGHAGVQLRRLVPASRWGSKGESKRFPASIGATAMALVQVASV